LNSENPVGKLKETRLRARQVGYKHPPAGELVARPGTRSSAFLGLGTPGTMVIAHGKR